ncbi:hypothetical protein [Streptomyces sp. M92]|uniref:hypothetical protein n=1 Tax=Streptomyces sp. M92 TaxID=2944250 RepID=UPI00234AFEC7|nr:hypothetical protein [Streptomyces sp. M92]WCN01184.1 hypothetical protein M6G08_03390 [Streptomyces sp. M92]
MLRHRLARATAAVTLSGALLSISATASDSALWDPTDKTIGTAATNDIIWAAGTMAAEDIVRAATPGPAAPHTASMGEAG